MTAIKTVIFTIIAPGTVAGLVPYLLLSSGLDRWRAWHGFPRWPGAAIMAAGACIYFWCAWNFTFTGKGTPSPTHAPTELVAVGLYRFTRNPMYVGVISVLLGESLFFRSPLLLGYTLLVFLGFNMFIIFYEEPTLKKNFGESYERYCSNVPRWVFFKRRK